MSCSAVLSVRFRALGGHNTRTALQNVTFTDMPDWAKSETDSLIKAGITAGTEPGIFSPDEKVTKKQMDSFISRIYSLHGSNKKDDFYATVNKDVLNTLEIKPGRVIC